VVVVGVHSSVSTVTGADTWWTNAG
jgi:hypothetical protein